MDFVAKALGIGLPFSQGTEIPSTNRFWKLYTGTIRKTNEPCTVFVHQGTDQNVALAQNCSNVLRKLKIPGVIKLLETCVVGDTIYIATESVRPVSEDMNPESVKWLLATIFRTLQNLHEFAKCTHGNITSSNIYQKQGTGEFVLGGFEIASFPSPSEQFLRYGPLIGAPEPKGGWSHVNELIDTDQFFVLVKHLLPYQRLPARRPLEKLPEFLSSPVVDIASQVDSILLMGEVDFVGFLRKVSDCVDSLPSEFIAGRIIPELVKTEGKGGISLPRTILKLTTRLSPEQAADCAAPYIVKLWSSLDRALRLELLRELPNYIDVLSPSSVQNKIMPCLSTGFGDSEVLVRRASLASVPTLSGKLTSRQLNGELLRLLAKTHNDLDPEIRAQTVEILALLAMQLAADSRSQVVPSALGKSLKDPAEIVRRAALKGVRATSELLSPKEVAEKLVGPSATAVLDSNPTVAFDASKVLDALVRKVKSAQKPLLESQDVSPSPKLEDALRGVSLKESEKQKGGVIVEDATFSHPDDGDEGGDGWGDWNDEIDEGDKSTEGEEEDAWGW